jgi:sugar fermentation stimulation protein A
MPDLLYVFPPLQSGVLLKRYKRFFADIQLDSGQIVTAHCPNTGPMTGVCLLGNRVMVSSSDDPKRKLKYTWELIEVDDDGPVWVGVNTALPNRVIRKALEQHAILELGDYCSFDTEVKYGREGGSRIDFRLTDMTGGYVYVEVKNTTWSQGRLALFPDTVTTRGQKHLRELTALRPQERAVMLYYINREDCDRFAPGDDQDPEYGRLLRDAMMAGVEVLACRFRAHPKGVEYLGPAEICL